MLVLFAGVLPGESSGAPLHLKGHEGLWSLGRIEYIAALDSNDRLTVMEYHYAKGGPYFGKKEFLKTEQPGVFVNGHLRVIQQGFGRCSDFSKENKKCIEMGLVADKKYDRDANLLGMNRTLRCADSLLVSNPNDALGASTYLLDGTIGLDDSFKLAPDKYLERYLANLHAAVQRYGLRLDSNIVRVADSCAENDIVDLPRLQP